MKNVVIQYVALVVVAVFAAGIWLSGDTPSLSWLRFYSVAIIVATLGLLLWEHWIWRWTIIQRLPKVPRSVRGTWHGTLESQWIDPANNQPLPAKTVYAVVRQTASTVKLTLLTDESVSASSLGQICEADGTWSLDYLYLNQPNLSVEHRSRVHHGSGSFRLSGLPVERITGRYWTDRDSKGEITLARRHKALVDDYQAAEALFKKVP